MNIPGTDSDSAGIKIKMMGSGRRCLPSSIGPRTHDKKEIVSGRYQTGILQGL
jgi:hypothetical protein